MLIPLFIHGLHKYLVRQMQTFMHPTYQVVVRPALEPLGPRRKVSHATRMALVEYHTLLISRPPSYATRRRFVSILRECRQRGRGSQS